MDIDKIRVRRSFIFTPGLQPEMFPKALASGADMVCIELEDGIAIKDKNCFSVQYHPEANPGPHDSSYLFDQFIGNLKK